MSDYIKREDVLSAFKNAIPDVFEYDTYDELLLDEGISRERCQKIISNIPPADAKEIKHGKWILNESSDEHWKCSCCHYGYTDFKIAYCYDCGAKMDLEEEK